MQEAPVCFLLINTPVVLTKISISSCLRTTQNEIYLGFIDIESVAPFLDNPRIHLVDLSKESQQLGILVDGYKDFSQSEFFQLVQLKWELITKIFETSEIRYLQYSDLDVIWISDPSRAVINTFESQKNVKMLIQDFTTDPSLPNLCMGYCAVRNDSATLELLLTLKGIHVDLLTSNPYLGDDDVVTKYYRENKDHNIMTLPQVTFPVGNMGLLFSKKTFYPGINPPTPYIFHANFVIGLRRKIEYLEMVSRIFKMELDGVNRFTYLNFKLSRILRTIKFRLQFK